MSVVTSVYSYFFVHCNLPSYTWWGNAIKGLEFFQWKGRRDPVMIRTMSLSAESASLACTKFLQAGAAYFPTKKQSARAGAVTHHLVFINFC